MYPATPINFFGAFYFCPHRHQPTLLSFASEKNFSYHPVLLPLSITASLNCSFVQLSLFLSKVYLPQATQPQNSQDKLLQFSTNNCGSYSTRCGRWHWVTLNHPLLSTLVGVQHNSVSPAPIMSNVQVTVTQKTVWLVVPEGSGGMPFTQKSF